MHTKNRALTAYTKRHSRICHALGSRCEKLLDVYPGWSEGSREPYNGVCAVAGCDCRAAYARPVADVTLRARGYVQLPNCGDSVACCGCMCMCMCIRMYMCMCMCVCVYVYVCMYLCLRACVCVCVNVCVQCMCVYVYVYVYMCVYSVCVYMCMCMMYVCVVHVCMHMCVYVRVYICMCMCVYTYVCMHAYMYAYIYAGLWIHMHCIFTLHIARTRSVLDSDLEFLLINPRAGIIPPQTAGEVEEQVDILLRELSGGQAPHICLVTAECTYARQSMVKCIDLWAARGHLDMLWRDILHARGSLETPYTRRCVCVFISSLCLTGF